MRKAKIINFATIIFLNCISLVFANDNVSPQAILTSFLKSEFNGNETSWCDYGWLSGGRRKKEKQKDHNFKGCVVNQLQYAKIVIVSYYEVVNLENKSETEITATVKYQQVAKTKINSKTKMRYIVPETAKNQHVIINLKKINNKWLIVDPEIPRVSIDAVIKSYEEMFKDFDERWLSRPDITEEQLAYYNNDKKAYETLKEVKRKTKAEGH